MNTIEQQRKAGQRKGLAISLGVLLGFLVGGLLGLSPGFWLGDRLSDLTGPHSDNHMSLAGVFEFLFGLFVGVACAAAFGAIIGGTTGAALARRYAAPPHEENKDPA